MSHLKDNMLIMSLGLLGSIINLCLTVILCDFEQQKMYHKLCPFQRRTKAAAPIRIQRMELRTESKTISTYNS